MTTYPGKIAYPLVHTPRYAFVMHCDQCNSHLMEVDLDGERLTGCLQCNRWQSNKRTFVVELSVGDLQALRKRVGLGESATRVLRDSKAASNMIPGPFDVDGRD